MLRRWLFLAGTWAPNPGIRNGALVEDLRLVLVLAMWRQHNPSDEMPCLPSRFATRVLAIWRDMVKWLAINNLIL